MQRFATALALSLLVQQAAGAALRAGTVQEPDVSCGRGFDNLVKGSRDYFATASVKLWTHPSHRQDNATFEKELQCWFAQMCTSKCGGLPSQAEDRKEKLTKTCMTWTLDWLPVWKMFSTEEVTWFKKNFPAEETDADVDEPTIHYRQAMHTMKEVSKKELLCLTLFTIDDECVKWPYIRLAK